MKGFLALTLTLCLIFVSTGAEAADAVRAKSCVIMDIITTRAAEQSGWSISFRDSAIAYNRYGIIWDASEDYRGYGSFTAHSMAIQFDENISEMAVQSGDTLSITYVSHTDNETTGVFNLPAVTVDGTVLYLGEDLCTYTDALLTAKAGSSPSPAPTTAPTAPPTPSPEPTSTPEPTPSISPTPYNTSFDAHYLGASTLDRYTVIWGLITDRADTPTPTPTPTVVTPTATPTTTPTPSTSPTVSPSPTPTVSPSPTAVTPSVTPTMTMTPTPSPTSALTPTPTMTMTPTITPTAPPTAPPTPPPTPTPEYGQACLDIRGLEDLNVPTTRASATMGWRYRIYSWDGSTTHFGSIFDNQNAYADDAAIGADVCTRITIVQTDEAPAVQAGDFVTYTATDGTGTITGSIYLPVIGGSTYYYIGADGTTYTDRWCTETAQPAP